MMARYPQCEDAKIDQAAEREMAAVKDIVNAARNLRSTLGVQPAVKVPLYIADAPDHVKAHSESIKAIARISELHIVAELPTRDSPVTITPSGKVMLHVEIDKAAEKLRLEKAKARTGAEIANARARLSNPTFVDKAPAAVVEQERKRLADKEAELAQIVAQLAKLN
jgi:valyl-tRNA synthetase